MTTTSFSGRSWSASSASIAARASGVAGAQAEEIGVRAERGRDGSVDRRVGAEVDREPAVGLEQDGEREQPELVPLPRRAGEHGRAADGRAAVAQERAEPLEHDLAEQMLLGDALRAGLPAVADQPQRGCHDLLHGGLDVVKRERLLDERGQPPRVGLGDRGDDRIPQSRRRGLRARVVRLQQSRGLADPEALGEAVAQPLHPRDVPLVVAALAARRAARAEHAVPPLPFAECVGPDPGSARDGGDVEPGAEVLRRRARLQVGGDGRGEILQHARVVVGPRPRPGVDRAERADRRAAGSEQRHADVGDDPQHPDRRAVLHERVAAGVLDQQRPTCSDRVLAGGV